VGIPKEVKFCKKWEPALEMIDQVRSWQLGDRIVVADAGYGDVTAFREALETRKLRYAVGVQSNKGVWIEPPRLRRLKPCATGRPPSAWHYGNQRPVSVKEAAQRAEGWERIRWREGSKGWLESRFWASRVRASHGFHEGREPGKEIWLLVEWPEETAEPTKYFFCDLPADYSLRRLVRVAKARWKIEQDYQQLKEELGLDHYEGRSWNGWHHHVPLVMLAHSFLTLETLRNKKNFWLDPAGDTP
jgi:SRSO17 transposase